MDKNRRLKKEFYLRDVLEVAPDLIGKFIVVVKNDGATGWLRITETEAYRGTEDKACHASKGRTDRTEIMYHEGGRLYIYLIYGMYWMLNVVTGKENSPQAVLIRGIENYSGPGRLTKAIGIDKSYYGEDLLTSQRIWIEDDGIKPVVKSGRRIGIDYAGDYWINKPWRYYI
jgi:DNA-3-methyladenine glycosylase